VTDSYNETPIFESSSKSLQKDRGSKLGYVLVGVGAFVLAAQFVPGSLFLPLLFIAAGIYLLRKDKKGLYFTGRGRTFTRCHALVSLGSFFLLSQIVPGGLLVPLLLIAAGYYLLRQREQRAII
jgi:hypothetical protein